MMIPILIILLLLPILYKYSFWLYVIQLKEYRWDRFTEYAKTPQGKKALCNFWFLIEIPVYILGVIIWYSYPDSLFAAYVFMILFAMMSMFVALKLLRKQISFPKLTSRLSMLLSLLVVVVGVGLLSIYIKPVSSYIVIPVLLGFPYLIIFLVNFILAPLVIFLKNRKIYQAIAISKKYSQPVKIGITGSYGKTSIKEYLSQVLAANNTVLSTPKNINSELGVTNFILTKLSNSYDYFVAEMGAYRVGEIETLGNIVNHTHGFLTAIGNQHIGLFGGIEKTTIGKSEIYKKILENKGVLYVNWENEIIQSIDFPKNLNIIKYGNDKNSDVEYSITEIHDGYTHFDLSYKNKNYTLKTNLLGKHSILNLSGVIACALDLGNDVKSISDALEHLKVPENTLEIHRKRKRVLINDTYNMSQDGLMAGIEVLSSFEGEKVLVLDDILELGKDSHKIHQQIGKTIAQQSVVDKVMHVGVNYRQDFILGLQRGGFDMNNLVEDIEVAKKQQVVLFEGRSAKSFFNKYR